MVDLPPAHPTVTTTPASSTAASTSPNAVQTTIVSLPDTLNQLTRQIELTANVAQTPTGAAITLQTPQGNIVISLANLSATQQQQTVQQLLALFDAQKPLTLIVNPGTPPTQAFLFLPSAQTANATSVATPALTPGATAPTSLWPAAVTTSPSLTAGTTVSAIVLPNGPAPFATAAEANPANLLAAGAAAQAIPTEAPIIPVATPNVSPLAQILQPGANVDLRITAVALPGTANAATLQATAPNQLIASVIGKGPEGQLILKAGETSLFVEQAGNLPVGTTLQVEVSAAKAVLPLPLPDLQATAPLQQFFAALTQFDPQLAQQVLTTQLPQLNENFPAALLFMLSAIKQGDAGWLDKTTTQQLAQMGKFELLGKLAQGMAENGQTVADGAVGQWQSYAVPLYAQQQLQILNLYVHHDPDRQNAPAQGVSPKGFTRFIIDVNFSKLGAMQLDGFAQPKKLDMIVRSEQPLPPGLAHELRFSYHAAMEAIDFAGSLGFQNGRKNWLTFNSNRAGAAIVT